jgi:predicted ATPase
MPRAELPSGTVTFLFTDVEGSTRLLHELGAEGYAEALGEHRRVIRDACAVQGGVEVDTQGDAFFFAFPSAGGAVAAAAGFTDALASGPIQVRVGLHTGAPLLTDEGYVGDDVHFAARVAATSHGGQVVLSTATAELVDGHELVDLGEHRLKDIEHAVSIFQLGGGSFPPLKTISNTNLPRPASSFLGREAELEEVLGRIEHGTRLLTLTGPGGTGKTRLAIEAASTLVPEYKAGVFWVGLASLRDPALVSQTIAQTLGAKDELAAHIGEREMLLLLDNFEQVVEAGPELSQLLESCPNLDLLVTSRELLRVQGEVEYAVPPLAEPEAIELFCERSRLEPSEVIAELCARLDSLPLAVELAAARTRALTPAQVLERLSGRLDLLKGSRDADPRQQTLRATIEWSHDLLAPEEQQLFARLSVFAGGCTLDAAEQVSDAHLDTLQSLVEKSLLRFADGRYWMLETIREYARERLPDTDEFDPVAQRHARYFTALADLPRDVSATREWLDAVEAEESNLRTTLDYLLTTGDTQPGLQATGSLWRFWSLRGRHVEGLGRVERFLEADKAPTQARAYALIGATPLAVNRKAYDQGRRYAEEAHDIYRELEDAWGIARALVVLGVLAVESGDFARARPFLTDALTRFRRLGSENDILVALINLSWSHYELGDRTLARELVEDALVRAQATASSRHEASALALLAEFSREDGRLVDALDAARGALRIRRDEGDIQHQLDGLSRFASIHARAGRLETAAILVASSVHLHAERGMDVPFVQEKRNELTEELIAAGLGETAATAARAHGRSLSLDEAVEYALASID